MIQLTSGEPDTFKEHIMGTVHMLLTATPHAAHPAFTANELATMSASELLYFTDAPVAHAVAYADFRRAAQIEARGAGAAHAFERRTLTLVYGS
jgi:hypothetical protein